MNTNTEFYKKFRKHHIVNVHEEQNKTSFYICHNLTCSGCIFNGNHYCEKYNSFSANEIAVMKQKYPEDFV